LNILDRFSKKYSNIKSGYMSSKKHVVPYKETGRQADGQTDTHDKANGHFLKFCEHAYKQ
jgi:hypothetical protein